MFHSQLVRKQRFYNQVLVVVKLDVNNKVMLLNAQIDLDKEWWSQPKQNKIKVFNQKRISISSLIETPMLKGKCYFFQSVLTELFENPERKMFVALWK